MLMLRRKENNMLKRIVSPLILSLVIFSSTCVADLESDYVQVQAENIQLTADLSTAEKQRDMYKKLYESEQFWGNIKDVVILVAIVSL